MEGEINQHKYLRKVPKVTLNFERIVSYKVIFHAKHSTEVKEQCCLHMEPLQN